VQAEFITAADGTQIAMRVYEPDSPDRGSVVIGGAMGVRQDYYAPFAQWLSGQGWRVTTFDYRGSGDSLPNTPAGGLKGFKADLFDWTRDYEAAIDHAARALPGQPLYLLGHSLGAQLPGLINNQHKVSGLLSVAAGSGYWRENAPQLKRIVPYFWFFPGAAGYAPVWLLPRQEAQEGGRPAGRRHPAVAQVVPEPALQRGCRRRGCAPALCQCAVSGHGAVHHGRRAHDPAGTQSLFNLYENAQVQVQRVAPGDVAVRRLGHFGPFRSEHEAMLWPRMQQWLSGLALPVAA
jgi:predicted alpha/beta hydrolase